MDYAFEAKQRDYREQVWRAADSFCPVPVQLRKVALLDTSAGLEVRHLLSLGYRPEHILAINYNPAHLAAMTLGLKKDGITGVRTRAGDFCDVLWEWDDRVDVVSFDTTSNVASPDFLRIAAVVAKHRPHTLIEVMLAGREDREWSLLIDAEAREWTLGFVRRGGVRRDSRNRALNQRHLARARWAIAAATQIEGECVAHVRRSRVSSYMSTSGQPMVWLVAGLSPHRDGHAIGRLAYEPCCLRRERCTTSTHEIMGPMREHLAGVRRRLAAVNKERKAIQEEMTTARAALAEGIERAAAANGIVLDDDAKEWLRKIRAGEATLAEALEGA